MPQMPEGGQRPDFSGGFGGMMSGFSGSFDGETQQFDIASARIAVEIEGGKESGSMDSITPGSFVTLTVNSKGVVTYVLVSESTGFSFSGSFPGFTGAFSMN